MELRAGFLPLSIIFSLRCLIQITLSHIIVHSPHHSSFSPGHALGEVGALRDYRSMAYIFSPYTAPKCDT